MSARVSIFLQAPLVPAAALLTATELPVKPFKEKIRVQH
jgi:hypothetical protein